MRFFNENSDFTYDDIKGSLPHSNEFYLTKWIVESEMSDQGKIDHERFHVCGGYLKTYDYKEAWANFWRDTDEENRQKFLNLPNFDAVIFHEITGIDISKKESLGDIIEINGQKYKKNINDFRKE